MAAALLGAPSAADGNEYRSIDGWGNHLGIPEMGAAQTPLLRMMEAHYGDQVSSMTGSGRLGAREISNLVCDQPRPVPARRGASAWLWQWGQFLDHDLDLTGSADPAEPEPIPVPGGDVHFDPWGTGGIQIQFLRSAYDPASGSGPANPREQVNQITAWIDASNVYGSSEPRALALRTLDGTGRLRTSEGDLLPFNTEGLPNAGGPDPALFVAGDVRANEQVALTAVHTLFVREHNRLAAELARAHPDWSGDQIYDRARQLVGAEMQVITYAEFLPALLGRRALGPYRGYDPGLDASIANEFSTAAYRFGHSALGPELLRLDERGRSIEAGPLALRDAFFAPQEILENEGIEPILRGLSAAPSQRIDVFVIDEVRNFLFGPPGAGGLDLASLNIQRGRDHGLPAYNEAREAMGLPRAESFADISSNEGVQARLAQAYAHPDDVDLWVGGLAEDVFSGHLGELFTRILADQFDALRHGDRLWYTLTLLPEEILFVESVTLADVIRWNTPIRDEIPADVFRVRRGGR